MTKNKLDPFNFQGLTNLDTRKGKRITDELALSDVFADNYDRILTMAEQINPKLSGDQVKNLFLLLKAFYKAKFVDEGHVRLIYRGRKFRYKPSLIITINRLNNAQLPSLTIDQFIKWLKVHSLVNHRISHHDFAIFVGTFVELKQQLEHQDSAESKPTPESDTKPEPKPKNE